jgi:uncharacterized lipoprotein
MTNKVLRMKVALKVGAVLAVSVALSGCHPFSALKNRAFSCHVKQPYMAARNVPPLQIPSGLDKPDRTDALTIPDLKEPPPPARSGHDPCLDEPPPFKTAPTKPTA